MRSSRLSFALAIVHFIAWSSVASASPTMVRLGYSRCSACHLAPQGAGLLTDYGKGIDEAQSLRAAEDHVPDEALERVLRYDVRLLTSGFVTTAAPSGSRPASPSWLRSYFRNAVGIGARNRLASSVLLEAPAGRVDRFWSGEPVLDLAVAWEYTPSDHFTFAVARDRLPRGVELGETRTILQEGWTQERFPTQLKAFFNSERFQATTYAYGPGSDDALDADARGAGGLAEVHLFSHHLILGGSYRHALSTTATRRTVGSYVRFGVGRWGILAEHEFTNRDWAEGLTRSDRRYAGYTQVFAAPWEWLVTSMIGEHSVEPGASHPRIFRWRPEVQARLTPNVTVTASARNDVIAASGGTSRIYLLQVSLKTVQ
jgi:hypothetical protein